MTALGSARYSLEEARRFVVGQVAWWEGLLAFYAARAVDVAELELKLTVATLVFDAARTTAAFRQRAAELGSPVPDRRVPEGAPLAEQRARISWLRGHVLPNIEALGAALACCEPLADEPTVLLLLEAQSLLRHHLNELERVAADDHIPWCPVSSVRPARDPRLGSATAERARIDPRSEVLHRNFADIELPTIEVCASAVIGFPDMPTAFVLDMARQCWDEARHARLFWARLEEVGGVLGSVGHQTALWQLCAGQPLALQLAINQRWGEWSGVCGALWHAEGLRAEGDVATARLFEYVLADEVLHVASGNRWLRFLVPDRAQRELIDAEAAARRRAAGRSAPPDAVFPFNRELCERCGFEPRDVDRLEQHYLIAGSRMRPIGSSAAP